jgi:hypothetical protein
LFFLGLEKKKRGMERGSPPRHHQDLSKMKMKKRRWGKDDCLFRKAFINEVTLLVNGNDTKRKLALCFMLWGGKVEVLIDGMDQSEGRGKGVVRRWDQHEKEDEKGIDEPGRGRKGLPSLE